MYGRFVFDDAPAGNPSGLVACVAKTANYTVVAGDNCTVFTTTGAAGSVTFTLPAPAKGLRYVFFNTVNQNMVVQSAVANKLVAFNNATASSVALQTANQKIGGGFEVVADETGSFWLVLTLASGGQTVTVA